MASLSKENYNPEESLLETLDNLDIGFVKVSNDGIILTHNLTFNKIFGYNLKADLISTKTLDYWLNSEERNKFIEILFKNGIVKKYGAPAKKVDGEKIFLQMNFKLNKNSNGEIISSEGTFVDVTERIETEQPLRESEMNYRNLIEHLGMHLLIIDRDEIFQVVNEISAEAMGGKPTDFIGKSLNDVFPKDVAEKYIKVHQGIFKSGKGITFKHTLNLPIGTKTLYTSEQPVKDINGNIKAVQIISLDTTETKITKQKLEESEKKLKILNKELEQRIEERTQELKEYESKFRVAIESLPFPFYMVDGNGQYIIQNTTAKKVWGDLIGKRPKDIANDEETLSLWLSNNSRAFSGETLTSEAEYNLNGEIRCFYDIVAPIYIDNKVQNILGVNIDITERKRAEQKVKESEKRLLDLIEAVPIGISISTPEGKFIECNSERYKISGFASKEEFLNTPVLEFYDDPKDRARFVELHEKGLVKNFEVKLKRKDGTTYWSSITSTEQKLGKKVSYINTFQDITERKKAEQKLKESEEKYRTLFESSGDGIASSDMEGNLIDANKAFLDLLGYSKEELLKLMIRQITPSKWHEIEDNLMITQLSEERGSGVYEKEYIKKDGIIIPVNIRFWIVKDDQGDPIMTWAIVRDITERKKAEEKIANLAKFPSENPYTVLRVNRNQVIYVNKSGKYLLDIELNDEIPDIIRKEVDKAFDTNSIINFEIELKDRIHLFTITPFANQNYVNLYGMDITERKHVEENLKEVNELKSEFLRRASHELKTPLISIKGFSELILTLHEDQLDIGIISKLREINDGCERLQNIINNLLETSRLESPDLKPKVQKEDLSFLIKFCVNELQSLAERRKQSIELDIHNELYANIEKEEIHDVLSNLLTNAIKYTPPMGKIKIKTELNEDSVVVSVKDNGIGFIEEQKTKIFQQFGKIERYGQGLDLGIDGTGLGLYISKRIVESHGGKIWMESDGKNKGSTFYFSLPLI